MDRDDKNVRNGLTYVIDSMLIFSIIGLCIKVLFGNNTSTDGTYGRANSAIWGYGIVALSLLVVMFVNYAIHSKIDAIKKPVINLTSITGILDFVKSFVSSFAPFAVTIVCLFWIITINVNYFKKINQGSVATEYYQLSSGTSFLFGLQIICLFLYLKTYIKNEIQQSNELQSSLTRYQFATYFIGMINIIITGMMTITLQFFSTDG